MADILFDMPMDEAVNSPIAYDFSIFGNNGTVYGASFVPGQIGYAAHFDGNSYIRVPNPIPNLSLPFTLLFWFRSVPNAQYQTPDALLFQFAFSDNSIVEYQTPGIVLNQWQSIVLVKYSNGAKIYINGQLEHTMVFTAGDPVEWAIKQHSSGDGFTYTLPMTFGSNSASYALGDVDNVLIYNEALTPDQINQILNPSRRVLYKIDGIPFEDFDVYVKESFGVIDALELKEPTTVDWAGEHGQIVDLKRPRYKPREIELNCFILHGSPLTYAIKFDNFIKQFQTPGLHRLKIEIDSRKPLLYEVYLPGPTDNDKKWRPDTVGNFKLKLIDPQPIRRVLRFIPTAQNLGIAKIRFTCQEAVNIYWGDGTHHFDVIAGDDLTISRNFHFPNTGIAVSNYNPNLKPYYEIMITGEVNNITNFSHNCILIWNRL